MQRQRSEEAFEGRSRRRVFFDDDESEQQHALSIREAETEYNQQFSILEKLENGRQWSGNGDKCEAHIEDLDTTFQEELRIGETLKEGRYGTVTKVRYRNVDLARKTIQMSRFSKEAKKLIRQEGSIGQSLDSHRHIIKLVGTFWESSDDPLRCTFNILTFPVAVCDLEQMLEDCEEFSMPKKITGVGWIAVMERLRALNFNTNKSMLDICRDMKPRLQEIMGCLTEGIVWMHSQNCQHRDIKPANVLVRPGRVLITDFGISRDQRIADQTTTELSVGGSMGYMPPEVLDGQPNNPAHSDIYSLGCVFLRILSVIHGPNEQLKMVAEQPHPHPDRFRERQFKEFITIEGRTTQHQILPLQNQELIANMLEDDRHQRPTAENVSAQLIAWSKDGEKYHGPCCYNQLATENLSEVADVVSGMGNAKLDSASEGKPQLAPKELEMPTLPPRQKNIPGDAYKKSNDARTEDLPLTSTLQDRNKRRSPGDITTYPEEGQQPGKDSTTVEGGNDMSFITVRLTKSSQGQYPNRNGKLTKEQWIGHYIAPPLKISRSAYPEEGKWYRVLSQDGKVKTALEAYRDGRPFMKNALKAAVPADRDGQYWQLKKADPQDLWKHWKGSQYQWNGTHYWLFNKAWGKDNSVSLRPDRRDVLDKIVWYFDSGRAVDDAMLIQREGEFGQVNFVYLKHTGRNIWPYCPKEDRVRPPQSFWYLEVVLSLIHI